jgi:cytoskeleton protein RodZ
MEPQLIMEPLLEDRRDDDGPQFREGVGEMLRRRRESFGQDLPTVASQLHIRLPYLKAVESGRFKDLPGMAYASGFVRSYAEYLGLNAEEVVRQFREEVAGAHHQIRLNVPIVASEGRIPSGAILLLSGFLALLAYGVWFYLADRHKNLMDMVPEVPSQLRAILGKEVPPNAATTPPVVKPQVAPAAPAGGGATSSPGAVASAAEPSRTASAPSTTSASLVATASATPSATASQPAPVTAAPPQPAAPAPPPAPPATSVLVEPSDLAPSPEEFSALLAANQPPASPDGQPAQPPAQVVMASPGARIKLVARMDSWVQINDKTGKTYYAAVLRAGQAIEVPNQPGLLLTAGNAGGLEVSVDGSPLPSLGAVGLVRRDLPLDPAELRTKIGQ